MRYTKDENYSIMNVTHLHLYSVMLFLDNPYFLHHSLSFFYLEYPLHFFYNVLFIVHHYSTHFYSICFLLFLNYIHRIPSSLLCIFFMNEFIWNIPLQSTTLCNGSQVLFLRFINLCCQKVSHHSPYRDAGETISQHARMESLSFYGTVSYSIVFRSLLISASVINLCYWSTRKKLSPLACLLHIDLKNSPLIIWQAYCLKYVFTYKIIKVMLVSLILYQGLVRQECV